MTGLTIFLSAFLLFEVQPLVARQILPWFGGSAAVWTASMLFFQLLLLAGYSYAHGSAGRLAQRSQSWLHGALLALSLVFLPLSPPASLKPAGQADPTLGVLLVLAATVGLPYLVLSATNPLLGAWFARLHPDRDPYRLFSLSNLGALLALLTYPCLVEPGLTLRQQSWMWSALYLAFAVCIGVVARRAALAPRVVVTREEEAQPPPSPGLVLLWLALSACPSMLLLSITQHLTQNVAAIPLLWVVPLALYLVSFVLCFSSLPFYQRWLFWPALALSMTWMGLHLDEDSANESLKLSLMVFNAGLFAACMACHGELSRLKPASSRLTHFYLIVSLGGALGGTMVALLAPRLFATPLELPLALLACPLLLVAVLTREIRTGRQSSGSLALIGFLLTFTASLGWQIGKAQVEDREDSLALERNFFGPVRVLDNYEGQDRRRKLVHGTILHGVQFMQPNRRRWATTYYANESGVGLALNRSRHGLEPQKVGLVGLGTGTMASHGRKQDDYTFYDINPLVEQLARQYFSYLSDCPSQLKVVLGDARLQMERQPPQSYDLLVVDAFSGDSIPVHLLTREAFGLYFGHLKPQGILAVHITNRFVDLQPVVRSSADYYGKITVYVHNARDGDRCVNPSTWALVGPSDQPVLRGLRDIDRYPEVDRPEQGFRPWTDDFSNLFQILHISDD